ncbi:S8 family peptidase [Brevibacillus ginsengisoli]|uniref:S8 family peptidase n=1 Tax=Brevibacillus ginsengisoli TaxID=363854 RepID=UPI003CF475BB
MKRILGFTALTALLTTSLFVGVNPSYAGASKSQYLLAFQKNLPSDYESQIKKAGGKVLRAIPEIGGVEVETSDPSFLKNLKKSSGVTAANAEFVHKLDYKKIDQQAADGQPVTDIPQPEDTDSYWDYQWDMQRLTNEGKSYDIESGGTDDGKHKAVVGVIDSGIDFNHPDLKGNFLGGQNFVPAGVDDSETGDPNDVLDRDGHGTHVAGSIAGNGKVKGVGPNLGIRSYRVFPENGNAPTAWIVDAVVQATNDHVDVINMSIGGFDAIARYNFQGGSYNDIADVLLWKRAIQYAVKNNVTVVVAAGNESLNLNNPTEIADYMRNEYGVDYKGAAMEVPGQIPGVITVSSSNKWSKDEIAFYSNYGTKSIDVAAPGGDNGPVYAQTRDLMQRDFHYRTLSTWPTYLPSYFTSNLHGYALLHGTSMASPKVAGIAGVIKAQNPSLNPAQVTALIKKTAIDLGKKGTDQYFGSGEANAYNALK